MIPSRLSVLAEKKIADTRRRPKSAATSALGGDFARRALRPLRLKVVGSIFFLFLTSFLFAQKTDSTTVITVTVGDSVQQDTTKKKKIRPEHPPKRAALFSAVLPGAGQVYNRKYWKVPIIYAGLGGLGYAVYWNNRERKIYHDAIKLRFDTLSSTVDQFDGIYGDGDLVTLRDYYQRYRDLSAIGFTVLYALQIVDAAVDAHLWKFEQKMGDDLSLRIQPLAYPTAHGFVPGASLRISFR